MNIIICHELHLLPGRFSTSHSQLIREKEQSPVIAGSSTSGFRKCYSPYLPYYGAVAAPAPVVQAAPTYYPYPYPLGYHHPHRELHNVAGAVQRESGLLTDVSIRFPAKKSLRNF
ncbi:hypothetical protein ANCCAN_00831 [Ancylostoma caninum]|uniref:Uncharacterized protein n=1 Tax=Ancylostoma caninum TaxID=29170 RepID=A0A368H8E1_ANCCA|nr:hypothetical protein ANCCAN_00831 [Ancylostoma caninum]